MWGKSINNAGFYRLVVLSPIDRSTESRKEKKRRANCQAIKMREHPLLPTDRGEEGQRCTPQGIHDPCIHALSDPTGSFHLDAARDAKSAGVVLQNFTEQVITKTGGVKCMMGVIERCRAAVTVAFTVSPAGAGQRETTARRERTDTAVARRPALSAYANSLSISLSLSLLAEIMWTDGHAPPFFLFSLRQSERPSFSEQNNLTHTTHTLRSPATEKEACQELRFVSWWLRARPGSPSLPSRCSR